MVWISAAKTLGVVTDGGDSSDLGKVWGRGEVVKFLRTDPGSSGIGGDDGRIPRSGSSSGGCRQWFRDRIENFG